MIDNLPEDIFKKPYFWILVIAAALFTIYFGLLWKAEDVAHLGMSALFVLGAGSLIWDRKESLSFKTNPIAIGVAIALIVAILYGLTLDLKIRGIDAHPVVRLAALGFGIALALIAAGFPGLKQYRSEIIILAALSLPSVILTPWNLAPFTAQLASGTLWSMGYDVGVDGIALHLPRTTVLVARACSGVESVTYVLGISILYLVMFPLKRIHLFIVPIIAIIIGYLVNLVRVVAMSVLINAGKMEAFEFWHEGEGSLLVGIIAVLIFSAFYFALLKYVSLEEEEEEEEELERKIDLINN